MNKIEKLLRKLHPQEQVKILGIINKIENKNLKSLDVKRLSGHHDIFRVRKGTLRILFHKQNDQHRVISIEKSSDQTYNI